MSTYGWIITRDHLEEPGSEYDATGTAGPRDIPADTLEALRAGKGDTFTMYDDDDERYYTGRAMALEWDEEACSGPLDDYGTPNAGCTRIRWSNHPERNI